jgi:hypothetical protein
MSAFAFKGAGKVLMDIFTAAGESTGLQLKGNCKEISIKGDSDTEEITSNDWEDYGTVLASDTIPKPHTVTFVFNQLDAELFAAGFSGVSTTLTQTSGTITDQDVVMRLDRFVEIGKRMISAPVLKHTSGTPSYVLDTDYEINPKLGLIQAKTGGAITDLQSCKLSCSHAAINGSKITGATRANVMARIMIDGQERSTGKGFIFDGKKVRLASTTEVALIGDKFVEVSFSGTFQKPDDGSAVYDLLFLS